ncbi:MAG TPA: hypothetical protein V6D17_05250 [Candidatus Obscuribacterales bacterium]
MGSFDRIDTGCGGESTRRPATTRDGWINASVDAWSKKHSGQSWAKAKDHVNDVSAIEVPSIGVIVASDLTAAAAAGMTNGSPIRFREGVNSSSPCCSQKRAPFSMGIDEDIYKSLYYAGEQTLG